MSELMDAAGSRQFNILQSAARPYGEIIDMRAGVINQVAIVNSPNSLARYVIKTPLDDHPEEDLQRIEALQREHVALMCLADTEPPVSVPECIEYSDDPELTYLVMSFVSGKQAAATMETATPEELDRFGRSLGEVALWHAEAVDVDAFVQQITGPPLRWDSFIKERLATISDRPYPVLLSLLSELYGQWYGTNTAAGGRFMHGDTSPNNVTVSDDYSVTGLYDYGEAGRGTLSQEVSVHLYARLFSNDPTGFILQACLAEMGDNAPSVDEIQLWYDLKVGCRLPEWRVMDCYTVYRDDLISRYPDRDWSELY